MFRLTQILQNSLIRLQAWFDQFFNLIKNLFSWFKQTFISFSKLLGFTNAQDFLEINEGQSLKPTENEAGMTSKASQNLTSTDTTTRRRPDTKMDDFIKMARQVKTSK